MFHMWDRLIKIYQNSTKFLQKNSKMTTRMSIRIKNFYLALIFHFFFIWFDVFELLTSLLLIINYLLFFKNLPKFFQNFIQF